MDSHPIPPESHQKTQKIPTAKNPIGISMESYLKTWRLQSESHLNPTRKRLSRNARSPIGIPLKSYPKTYKKSIWILPETHRDTISNPPNHYFNPTAIPQKFTRIPNMIPTGFPPEYRWNPTRNFTRKPSDSYQESPGIRYQLNQTIIWLSLKSYQKPTHRETQEILLESQWNPNINPLWIPPESQQKPRNPIFNFIGTPPENWQESKLNRIPPEYNIKTAEQPLQSHWNPTINLSETQEILWESQSNPNQNPKIIPSGIPYGIPSGISS
jgi:hypothetical protein